MVARGVAGPFAAALVSVAMLASLAAARAEDLLKVAVAQRGQWDTAITELGERSGIFRKRGIAVEVLYTQGGPQAHQAVISGSMDIACGGGIESAIGGYSKGAPVRIIGSAMIRSPDRCPTAPSVRAARGVVRSPVCPPAAHRPPFPSTTGCFRRKPVRPIHWG
jgi:hypothetical protein